ncbi:MAG: Xaa-Pro peptidase family protein [Gammaproteobacteria bacterium]|nr:Xaa-Pro peptidase family protein [Gammaproteobacteria bacterium]
MKPDIQNRLAALNTSMQESRVDLCVFSDPDTIVYLCGFANYLGMEFGRASLLVVARGEEPMLITPSQEAEMAREMTGLHVHEWSDGVDDEWRKALAAIIEQSNAKLIGYEIDKTHPAIARNLKAAADRRDATLKDVTTFIGNLRVIKSDSELATMRQAGQVAVAMVEAGRSVIGADVPEYEVALAVIAGGTRKAAEFLEGTGGDVFSSPTIYNLQVMQSGHHTCMVHRRSSARLMKQGDPVYLCFCGIANFKHFKLGFDREFWIGSITDEEVHAYETAVKAQQAALAEIRPGAIAKEVHAAAEQVYLDAGFGTAYRTGRAIGYSFLEMPELKRDDDTALEAGMTFAVDGGIGVPQKFGARIGDSIEVTESGFNYLTNYPRELAVV